MTNRNRQKATSSRHGEEGHCLTVAARLILALKVQKTAAASNLATRETEGLIKPIVVAQHVAALCECHALSFALREPHDQVRQRSGEAPVFATGDT